ncbi:MAG: NeuD/PglB/VioB family sugar acetyltransferase, partial [Desulfosarcina sp.]|nr:NeuD/PglB/VioB family sugar acetyltransferase [Desulfosarcina sp.]
EPEALLASLMVSEGEPLTQDQVIALVETTKSTGEIRAESEGFLVGLRYSEGDTLSAGDVLGYIGDSPDAQDPALPPWAPEENDLPQAKDNPEGLRITSPARDLARQHGLDLKAFPQGPLITRQMVAARLSEGKTTSPIPAEENRLIVYGAGGHGRSLVALIRELDRYEIIGFVDDGYPPDDRVFGLPILGGGNTLESLAGEGLRLAVNGVGGVGDLESRLSVYEQLRQANFHVPSVTHPTAWIEKSAALEDGCQVFPFAYIGTQARVGFGCIVNTGVIVSHNVELGPYVNLSPGATLAGGVVVAARALIGMRATINLNVRVGECARIGNGATVKADVPDGGIVPAGTIWPPRY